MVAIESKDDLYVINLLEDFDEFYLDLEKFAEENRVPIIDKIGIRFLIQMLKIKKAKNLLEIGTAIGYTSIKLPLVSNLAITLIVTSHDLEIIKELTKKVIVMDSGNIIETGITKNFLSFQNHPYSRALVQASPFINIFKDLWGINEIETFRDINGCPFYSRCPQRISKCLYENPKLNKINEECQVACHLGGIINILEVNKLSKVYTSKKFKIEALSEVSLKVRMGEIVSIIGE